MTTDKKNQVTLAERAYVHHILEQEGEPVTIRRLAKTCARNPKNNYGETMDVTPEHVALVVDDLTASGDAYHVRGRGLSRLFSANSRQHRAMKALETKP